MKSFNGLTAKEAELLALLAEECGEVIQAVGKVLRHGFESRHPDGGPTNREALASEIGHTRAATFLLFDSGISQNRVTKASNEKLTKVEAYLHHFHDDGLAP